MCTSGLDKSSLTHYCFTTAESNIYWALFRFLIIVIYINNILVSLTYLGY